MYLSGLCPRLENLHMLEVMLDFLCSQHGPFDPNINEVIYMVMYVIGIVAQSSTSFAPRWQLIMSLLDNEPA